VFTKYAHHIDFTDFSGITAKQESSVSDKIEPFFIQLCWFLYMRKPSDPMTT